MSDTKLRPEDLRAKAEALIESVNNDTDGREEIVAWIEAVTGALAPEPEKAAKVETMADRIAADLKAGTFRGEQPAPPAPEKVAKVKCEQREPAPEQAIRILARHLSNCAQDATVATAVVEVLHWLGEPAPPEPAAPVNGSTPVGEYDPDMKPAATEREMPEAVGSAISALRTCTLFQHADDLEREWRNLAQPVAVGGWQLEELLKYADLAEVSLRTGFSPPDFLGVDLPYLLRSSIAVVRQQAAQGRKVELGKVRELIFMVRNLTPYLAQLGYADLSRSFNDYADAALAEIDAAEGKRTAGEHMSELSGEPLPHYLRDARLTANGMRAAAKIARNFRPKSACTCGGYISFHNGIPSHQPGCLVGECLEIADEIDARADEIDETPDRWLAELDAADGKGEGRG